MTNAEQLARLFHQTYERLAPWFDYNTRGDTREFDPSTPNGRLMIAVCGEVIRLQPDWNPTASELADACSQYLYGIDNDDEDERRNGVNSMRMAITKTRGEA